MLEIYKRIRTRREELGISQEELAKRMGYKSRSSINKIEKGENDIPQSKIVAFAQALQTTAEALMGWEQSPAPTDDDLPNVSPTGQKVDAHTRRQLEAVLDDDNLTYNGLVLNGEDKEKVKKALELIFWDVKKKNKRKNKREREM
ncbi:MAG: helix-turn-helix domain-containing protein [Selenomonas noxia]|uniref:helix-turn-helix domain-containing protein n=1 Tax=Selenomonas noxia TaxID=135083 RepID=UPI0032C076DE